MWKVQLFQLNYDERESQAVKDVVDSGWITMGSKSREFEERFEELIGQEYRCAAVSSCTAALHIALLGLSIGRGDEVIVPALTFVADANVVKMTGAEPVPADCESLDNWNLSIEDVERKITPRTKAVICVHFAGYACRMDELTELCRRRSLKLIEDVAHAPGADYGGRALGTFGEYGCFSFFTNKNLSVGEGGMLSCRDETLHRKAQHLRSQGMSTLTLDRHEGRAISYDVIQPGLNYRIDEIRAALGLVQIDKLKRGNEKRQGLTHRYFDNLRDVAQIRIPFRTFSPGRNAYHIFPILLDDESQRDSVLLALKDSGIQTSIHYPSFADFTAYRYLDRSAFPLAHSISKRELTLPLYPTMGEDNVDLVCATLVGSLQNLGG